MLLISVDLYQRSGRSPEWNGSVVNGESVQANRRALAQYIRDFGDNAAIKAWVVTGIKTICMENTARIKKGAQFMLDLFDFGYHRRLASKIIESLPKHLQKEHAEIILIADDCALVSYLKQVFEVELSAEEVGRLAEHENIKSIDSYKALVEDIWVGFGELNSYWFDKLQESLLNTLTEVSKTHLGFMLGAFTELYTSHDAVKVITKIWSLQLGDSQGWQANTKYRENNFTLDLLDFYDETL